MLKSAFSKKIRSKLKLSLVLGFVSGFSHGLEATIVTSTTPGVAWAPFTVDQFNPSADLTISILNQSLEQWESQTLYNFAFTPWFADEFGGVPDQLDVTVLTAEMEDQFSVPSSAWRGATGAGNSGVRALTAGVSVVGTESADWGSVSSATRDASPSFGNLALYAPPEVTLGDPYIEGLFYNKSTPTYMGFRFQLAGDPDFRYGWASITTIGASTLTVNSWAYNDAYGEDLPAGAVPEPASIAAISAIFVLGFIWFQRRRLF